MGKLIGKQINLFKNHLERPPSLKKSEKTSSYRCLKSKVEKTELNVSINQSINQKFNLALM